MAIELLIVVCLLIADITRDDIYLPFVVVGIIFGSEQTLLPSSDEGIGGAITIDPGFPFGTSVQTQVYVNIASPFFKKSCID